MSEYNTNPSNKSDSKTYEFFLNTINSTQNINIQNKKGECILHMAYKMNNLSLLKYLLSSQIDINLQRDDGSSALHIAIQNSFTSIAYLLIDANIDLNLTKSNSFTALHTAIYNQASIIIKHLLSKPVDINCLSKKGLSPIMLACLCGDLTTVQQLTLLGAKINQHCYNL